MKPKLTAVSKELPSPPYPSETKANGYNVEFDIRRIKASRTWKMAGNDCRNALLRVWFECWENIPVGTWPDDDEFIAASIDVTNDWFQGHKKRLMAGWVKHDDGNYYHEYITEKILLMIGGRRQAADRQAKYKERRKARAKEWIEKSNALPGVSDVLPSVNDGAELELELELDSSLRSEKEKNTCASGDARLRRFDEFWSLYPNKKGVAEARKKWKAKNYDRIADTIIAGLKGCIEIEWKTWPKERIPYGSTWVNQQRWEDFQISESGTIIPANQVEDVTTI